MGFLALTLEIIMYHYKITGLFLSFFLNNIPISTGSDIMSPLIEYLLCIIFPGVVFERVPFDLLVELQRMQYILPRFML